MNVNKPFSRVQGWKLYESTSEHVNQCERVAY